MKKNTLIILIVALLGTSCSVTITKENQQKKSTSITDTQWELTELNGKKIDANTQSKIPQFTLTSKENNIRGNGGCNSFFGTFQLINENGIKISSVGSTKMACHDDTIEQSFFDMLEKTDSFILSGDMLYLNQSTTILAKFKKAK